MFDVTRAELQLAALLMEHEDLLDEARGFGLRVAALPKGLMPLREAQQVIVSLGDNQAKLDRLCASIVHNVHDVPEEFVSDLDALLLRAERARDKCAADLKAAQEALAKHEDLLVGELFQEAFEAVRMAIVDFDPNDDIDLDFKTNLYLDKDPAYAVGQVILKRGSSVLYRVFVGYRASDDVFYGNIEAVQKSKTFTDVVRKVGRTKLSAFVRTLTEQLKAHADANNVPLFRSRKKVELELVDTQAVSAALRLACKDKIESLLRDARVDRVDLSLASNGKSAVGEVHLHLPWRWPDTMTNLLGAQSRFNYFDNLRSRLSMRTWPVQAMGEWGMAIKADNWRYRVQLPINSPQLVPVDFYSMSELSQKWPAEAVLRNPSLAALRERLTMLGIPFDLRERSPNKLLRLIKTIMPDPKGFDVVEAPITFTLTKQATGKNAMSGRVTDAFLRQAGATSFGEYAAGARVQDAFRAARDAASYEYGNEGYTGSLAEKSRYDVRRDEPFIWNGRGPMPDDMRRFIDQDTDRSPCDDKRGPACAVPVTVEQLLAKEDVTVTVEAKDEAEARRKAVMLIKARGRIPPKATILVEVPEGTKGMTLVNRGARVSTWSVTGVRKQAIVGEITGWYFYGWASS